MPERKRLKPIPELRSEDEEREFWATHSSMDYIDWNKAKRAVFPKLKRSKRLIPIKVSAVTYQKLSEAAKLQDKPLADVEKHVILTTLERFKGHRMKTAHALGIGVRTLGMKLKRWKEDGALVEV